MELYIKITLIGASICTSIILYAIFSDWEEFKKQVLDNGGN